MMAGLDVVYTSMDVGGAALPLVVGQLLTVMSRAEEASL